MDAMTTETTGAAAAMKARGFASQTPGEQAFSLFVFGLGVAVSGAFVYYLFTEPTRLTDLWAWTRSLNIWLQGVVWVLFLPWMVSLWLWTLPWAMPVRIVLVAAVLAWTNWLLWPWK